MRRTPGEQDSYRAELKAISVAISWKLSVTIVSDSQSTVQTVHKAEPAARPDLLQKQDHYDLVRQIWDDLHAPDAGSISLCKTKAHRDLTTITDLTQLYKAYANTFADQMAKHATQFRSGPWAEELRQHAHEMQQQMNETQAIYTYLVQVSQQQLERANHAEKRA